MVVVGEGGGRFLCPPHHLTSGTGTNPQESPENEINPSGKKVNEIWRDESTMVCDKFHFHRNKETFFPPYRLIALAGEQWFTVTVNSVLIKATHEFLQSCKASLLLRRLWGPISTTCLWRKSLKGRSEGRITDKRESERSWKTRQMQANKWNYGAQSGAFVQENNGANKQTFKMGSYENISFEHWMSLLRSDSHEMMGNGADAFEHSGCFHHTIRIWACSVYQADYFLNQLIICLCHKSEDCLG